MNSFKKKVATISGTGILIVAAVIAGVLIVHQGSNTNSKGVVFASSPTSEFVRHKVLSDTSTTNNDTDTSGQNAESGNSDGQSAPNGVTAPAATKKNTATTPPAATANPLPSIITPNPILPPVIATAPAVSVTSPASAAVTSGSVNLSANASDTIGVTSVQFMVDGANFGAAVTSAPYVAVLNTASLTNGSHTVNAVAHNAANLSTVSATVSFSVNNVAVTPVPVTGSNMILNPSVEDSTNGAPNGWAGDGIGVNTHAATYLNTGHTGTHSLNVTMSNRTDGDVKWGFTASLPVTAGQSYEYTDFYQSTVATEVDVAYTVNGVDTFALLGSAAASAGWSQFKSQFSAPAGTTAVKVYHILAANGSLTTDDFSLVSYTPAQFSRGLVSVTFDDGWANQLQNAVPVLAANGQTATFYIISGSLADQPDYMSAANVVSLHNAGYEIASHTVTHSDLTLLAPAALTTEMQQSQATLQATVGVPITNFAYPYGAYNAATIAEGQKYYHSQRSVNQGFNTKDNFNINELKIFEVDSNITQAQVMGWIDTAVAQHTWLILVFHEVAVTPSAADDALYTTQPADFTAEMNYLKQKAPAATLTVSQALNEIQPQL